MTVKYLPAVMMGLSVIMMVTIPYASIAHAQYLGNVGVSGETGVNTLEETLKVARDRVLLVQENPETGSGTPYFAADGILGALGISAGIFGGISLAFFAKARNGKYAAPGRG
jgi:hypothetical protein